MADKENNNALDEAQIKQILTNIPNNVSGDGKVTITDVVQAAQVTVGQRTIG